jgi:hypothetical protein
VNNKNADGATLVHSMYLTARSMSNELGERDYTSAFTESDWREYAEGLGAAFRALDKLLTNGEPFPHEWVIGNITIP